MNRDDCLALDGAEAMRLIREEHPDLVVALLGGKDGASLLRQFPAYGDGPVDTAGRIYLVDPLGNLMMSYPATAPDKCSPLP